MNILKIFYIEIGFNIIADKVYIVQKKDNALKSRMYYNIDKPNKQ